MVPFGMSTSAVNSAREGFRGSGSPRNSRGAARPEPSVHSATACVSFFRFSPFDQLVRVCSGAAAACGTGCGTAGPLPWRGGLRAGRDCDTAAFRPRVSAAFARRPRRDGGEKKPSIVFWFESAWAPVVVSTTGPVGPSACRAAPLRAPRDGRWGLGGDHRSVRTPGSLKHHGVTSDRVRIPSFLNFSRFLIYRSF